LLGTWHCLAPTERQLLRGFVLNKFRGDPRLLRNADTWLHERTGVRVVALVPYLRHTLPEEDAFFHRDQHQPGDIRVALVMYPWASNLDEFDCLVHEPGVSLVPITEPTELDGFHAVILPGSKNTVASLRSLRERGLAAQIARAARRGIPVIGICGGMQMLGHTIRDPHGLEGGDVDGLGLLDLTTELLPAKTVAQRTVRWREGGDVHGYEIHHGRSTPGPRLHALLDEDLGWQQENLWGTYLHGLFDNTAFRQVFLRRLGWQGTSLDFPALIDAELDRVAAALEATGWPQKIVDRQT
jgi:adenosylcobyric acid synthase